MKAAIYARYSSENQSEKSIDDQVRVCRAYASEHGLVIEEKDIYTDEAVSGSLVDRPGLQALEKAMEDSEFQAVVVDDLARLSRSNHQMLTLVLKLNYHQVKLISVSDGIVTSDDNAKVDIHLRGLINELYLDDLRKKTIRGMEGQKLRGFSAGERVYGYRTEPVGELKLNKKGQPKYEGMVHKIRTEEAEVVRRVYREFVEGKSVTAITAALNEDRIPTRMGLSGGWNASTVSRILKNEKYAGHWVWKKRKLVRDPVTGKKKYVLRPPEEHLSVFREDLVIIDEETWERAQKRWKELDRAWPVRKAARRSSKPQKSYVHGSPCHLLAGLMKCRCCGGPIVLVSGKGRGYYGCYNAKRKTCDNKLLVGRRRVEDAILSDLSEKILTIENLEYVYKNVEKAVAESLNEIPEQLKSKRAQYEKTLGEVRNYLNYIKVGNVSKAVSEALQMAEERTENLKAEIESMEVQKRSTFRPPPREWIRHRLEKLGETLSANTTASGQALKELLGTVTLEPILDREADPYQEPGGAEKKFKPYYVAHTKVDTLALLANAPAACFSSQMGTRADGEMRGLDGAAKNQLELGGLGGSKGSNWLRWRPQRDSNPCCRIEMPSFR